MKACVLLAACTGLLGLAACGNPTASEKPAATALPATWNAAARAAERAKTQALTSDWKTWYAYAYYQVRLSRRFGGLDTAARPMPRKAFLDQLATGRFIALRWQQGSATAPARYKLAPYPPNEEIARTSKQLADSELDYFRWEGQPLPAFRFRDLNGKAYTAATTLGKVLVLKAWFINCHACVEEFPQVNALAEKYQPNKDVLFISLAFNGAPELREFLARVPLKYAAVPDCEQYLVEKLKINGYPTHIIVGRDGRIVQLVGTADDLAPALARAVAPPSRPVAAR